MYSTTAFASERTYVFPNNLPAFLTAAPVTIVGRLLASSFGDAESLSCTPLCTMSVRSANATMAIFFVTTNATAGTRVSITVVSRTFGTSVLADAIVINQGRVQCFNRPYGDGSCLEHVVTSTTFTEALALAAARTKTYDGVTMQGSLAMPSLRLHHFLATGIADPGWLGVKSITVRGTTGLWFVGATEPDDGVDIYNGTYPFEQRCRIDYCPDVARQAPPTGARCLLQSYLLWTEASCTTPRLGYYVQYRQTGAYVSAVTPSKCGFGCCTITVTGMFAGLTSVKLGNASVSILQAERSRAVVRVMTDHTTANSTVIVSSSYSGTAESTTVFFVDSSLPPAACPFPMMFIFIIAGSGAAFVAAMAAIVSYCLCNQRSWWNRRSSPLNVNTKTIRNPTVELFCKDIKAQFSYIRTEFVQFLEDPKPVETALACSNVSILREMLDVYKVPFDNFSTEQALVAIGASRSPDIRFRLYMMLAARDEFYLKDALELGSGLDRALAYSEFTKLLQAAEPLRCMQLIIMMEHLHVKASFYDALCEALVAVTKLNTQYSLEGYLSTVVAMLMGTFSGDVLHSQLGPVCLALLRQQPPLDQACSLLVTTLGPSFSARIVAPKPFIHIVVESRCVVTLQALLKHNADLLFMTSDSQKTLDRALVVNDASCLSIIRSVVVASSDLQSKVHALSPRSRSFTSLWSRAVL
eukprot:TRINITY_DN3331_c0_g1_i1.p1 TRINITY_DN3331_c0_g1~~TRINITY_DN3331_c0_g1_i1.p1  ORF type:complete len:697 (+),score=128.74 TRINITY_DN3331_c0_g1_i1:4388-6478(+)